MKIKVAIADDHPMVIGGIERMLSDYGDDIECIGSFLNGAALLSGLEVIQPDVLLLDIQLSDINGDELLPKLRMLYPDMKVLVVTNFNSVLYFNTMMRLGAHGYLLKTSRQETLIEAVRQIRDGGIFVDTALEDQSKTGVKTGIYNKVMLTLREQEILQLIVDGKSNSETAAVLFLSVHTVKSYLDRIFVKLDVKNRAELTKKALQLGLVK